MVVYMSFYFSYVKELPICFDKFMENKKYDIFKLLLSTNKYSFKYKKCIVILWFLSFYFYFFILHLLFFLTYLFIYLRM